MGKTVFILGAGFSIEAGAPPQGKLIRNIIELSSDNSDGYNGELMKFIDLLEKTFLLKPSQFSDVPLEDIFTPLDRCIADNISFRNLDVNQVRVERERIAYLIGRTLQIILEAPESIERDKNYIRKFAEYLVYFSSKRADGKYKEYDPVAVISTNWDILLDDAIMDNLVGKRAVVDYCCPISSYMAQDDKVMPGLEMLGKGGFNVKLIKLHGSLNWLQCPCCLRVYVDFYNKIAVNQYIQGETCPHCDKNFGVSNSHRLISNITMPTFLKNFSNTQYKLIWQNAAIELSEASNIVFIGYSLPFADFELRQLLARMIREDAKIEVVDAMTCKPELFTDLKKRYQTFFGKREIIFYDKGARDYIQKNINIPPDAGVEKLVEIVKKNSQHRN